MQFEWKITHLWDLELVGKNGLEKKTIVLEEVTDKEIKNTIAIDFIKDRVKLLDTFETGDVVNVSINTRVNYSENTQRYYTSINAWRIELLEKVDNTVDDIPF